MHKLIGATLTVVMMTMVGSTFANAATTSPAFAGKKVAIYNHGEVIYEVGDIPEEWVKKHPEFKKVLAGKKAGYKCKVFGLFWAIIWKSSCTPVAFAGTNYFDENKIADPKKNWIADMNKAIAAKYKPSDMKMGFWAKFGKFILGAILLLMIGLGIYKKVKS